MSWRPSSAALAGQSFGTSSGVSAFSSSGRAAGPFFFQPCELDDGLRDQITIEHLTIHFAQQLGTGGEAMGVHDLVDGGKDPGEGRHPGAFRHFGSHLRQNGPHLDDQVEQATKSSGMNVAPARFELGCGARPSFQQGMNPPASRSAVVRAPVPGSISVPPHMQASSAARSHWRLRLRRREHVLDPLPETAVYGDQDLALVRSSLLEALGDLTPQQRAVIVLRYFADQDEANHGLVAR